MIRFDVITRELFMGEPPPVLYIFGSTVDFHELAIALLPLIKEDGYSVTNRDIDLLTHENIFITMSNKNGGGITISEDGKNIVLEFEPKIWIEVIIELVTLAFKPSHSYCDYSWLDNLNTTIILETL